MSDVILKVENLSKQYRLGLVGTGTIKHDLNRFWHRVRGKEDPYLKVGAVNDRSSEATENYVWALQEINFEVKRGEVLGIIGKNGAGKSTLLKILSRVTSPTTGVIKTKGRIASLLEVGTGFHPELTGRENIYLNGAILGMTKKEIKSKEEEIIEFSGCKLYIDTPVKRYSSGMRVRLGFAVAAFLDPDILIVDEVLAVGDAEFQKKAIGKMQDISKGDGRTVLFVSHNMASVQALCTKALVIKDGSLAFEGDVGQGIDFYLKDAKKDYEIDKSIFPIKNELFGISFEDITIHMKDDNALTIELKVYSEKEIEYIGFGFRIKDTHEMTIGSFTPGLTGISVDLKRGSSNVFIDVNDFVNVVSGGKYFFDVWVSKPKMQMIILAKNIISYEVEERDRYGTGVLYETRKHGLINVNGAVRIV
jgi:lipopolysaccharide transport system ATP-binding protein